MNFIYFSSPFNYVSAIYASEYSTLLLLIISTKLHIKRQNIIANRQKASMRSSTKSESNENNGNGSPCDNINNNSNDAEKLTTASMSQNATTTADVKAASKKSPTTSTARNLTEGVAGNVIDVSSTTPTECNSTFINQPAPTDNDSTIQKVEPVENSEKKVNVYEQVSAALHKSIRDRSHGMSLHYKHSLSH